LLSTLALLVCLAPHPHPQTAKCPQPARPVSLFLQKCFTYWEPAPYPCLASSTKPLLVYLAPHSTKPNTN